MTMMAEAKVFLPVAELPLEVACERIDPDAFDGLSVAMERVEFAATLRIAEVSPVGGLVAGAGEARLLDEGFEQNRSIGVAGLPVIGQTPADQGEDARGEVFAADSRQDEEAGVVDDEVQVALSLLGRPTDELVKDGIIANVDARVAALCYVGMLRELIIARALGVGDGCTDRPLEQVVQEVHMLFLRLLGLSGRTVTPE